jgi:hypothetical protein
MLSGDMNSAGESVPAFICANRFMASRFPGSNEFPSHANLTIVVTYTMQQLREYGFGSHEREAQLLKSGNRDHAIGPTDPAALEFRHRRSAH